MSVPPFPFIFLFVCKEPFILMVLHFCSLSLICFHFYSSLPNIKLFFCSSTRPELGDMCPGISIFLLSLSLKNRESKSEYLCWFAKPKQASTIQWDSFLFVYRW